jgi:gamma-glutamyltranspeptidase/glutathione hydrolase
VKTLQSHFGAFNEEDFSSHSSELKRPVSVAWGKGTAHVQPPASQGVLLAMALQWLDTKFDNFTDDQLQHILVEVTQSCFEFRSDCSRGTDLLSLSLDVDSERATNRRGARAYLHTAGVATADHEGRIVSSLVSVFRRLWVGDVGPRARSFPQ